jgi:hypothetical protein
MQNSPSVFLEILFFSSPMRSMRQNRLKYPSTRSTAMTDHIAQIAERAQDCAHLVRDIDLILPEAYEKNLPIGDILELFNGAASLYDLRFEALFSAYSSAIAEHAFFHYEIEEAVMQWWCACDDLRAAAEGAQLGLLDADGIANALLGIQALARVRGARFERALDIAKHGKPAPAAPLDDTPLE